MRLLTQKDLNQVAHLDLVLDAVEHAMQLYDGETCLLPNRMHINQGDNTLLLMPCLAEKYFATKLVSVFPKNKQKNKPIINGLVVLNNGETGEALALMPAGKITALRTGAVGGVSIKYLAPPNVKTLGLIGTGIQGFYQILFACHVRPSIEEVYLLNRSMEKIPAFITRLQSKLPHVRFHICKNNRALVEASEVVITSTNSATSVLPNDATLLQGKHFVGIGSYKPNMREFPDALFPLLQDIYLDTYHAAKECGDIAIPLAQNQIQRTQLKTLGGVIGGTYQVVKHPTTLFKSVGMALFDLTTAQAIYEKAVVESIGQEIEF